MARRNRLIWVLAACMTSPVAAELKPGQKAPRLRASQWYNLPGGLKKIEDKHLEGQIVAVEFWASWNGQSKSSISHLIELQKKFKNKGVILIALSGESDTDVEQFVTRDRIPYIVGSGAQATASDFQVKEIPIIFLLDPNGVVYWIGHPATVERPLEQLLKERPARSKGILAEKSSGDALATARKLMKQKKYAEAMDLFEQLSKDFRGTKAAKRAMAEIKRMKSNSKIMHTIEKNKAERATEGWLEVARMCAQYGDPKDAAKYYKRIMTKYPQAKASDLARQELKDLGIDPASIEEEDAKDTEAEGDDEEEGDEEDDDDEDEDEDEDE